jgi:hypothetical protein
MLIDNQLFYKYHELLTLIDVEICQTTKMKTILFDSKVPLPHSIYDDQPYEAFLTVTYFNLGYFYQ